jgi:hypothetical protein
MAQEKQETREVEVARVRSYLASQAMRRTPAQLVEALRESPGFVSSAKPAASIHLCHARRNPVACTAVDEFLAELEARMASATRASGVHPPLTAEALQVIAAADHGGTPMFTSANLARIAKENGVDVSSDMTPNDIIAELRRRQQPGS